MRCFDDLQITLGARDSSLSKAQVKELTALLLEHHPHVHFSFFYIKTMGDLDQTTPLSSLDKTDFFTKEVDEQVLKGTCRIAVHSAKDLPEKMPEGLEVICYTKSIDVADVLVLREGESLETLPAFAKIGTSSARRVQNLLALREDLVPKEIRGTIEKRLQLLDEGLFDGVIMAKAALLRLKLCRNEMALPGASAPRQGSLAVVAKKEDVLMKELFQCLDTPSI
jgi:hydroxymethylbilane synthase